MTGQEDTAGAGQDEPDPEAERAARAAYRAFVRENHPDRGGDVTTFVAGLAEFRSAGREGSSPRSDPTPTSRPRPADRYDAPVVGVVRPRGLRAVAVRVRRWWSRRYRKPRVR